MAACVHVFLVLVFISVLAPTAGAQVLNPQWRMFEFTPAVPGLTGVYSGAMNNFEQAIATYTTSVPPYHGTL